MSLVNHPSTQYLLILYPTTHYQPVVLLLTTNSLSLYQPPSLSVVVGKPPPTPGLIMDYIERHLLNQGRTVTTTTASLSNSGSGSGSGGSTIIPGGGATANVASAARKQELAIEALTLAYTVSPTFTPTPSQVLLAQQYKQALTTMHDKVAVGRSYKPLSASATSVCVIPQKGEYFVPAHLRTIWRRLQSTFFHKVPADVLNST